MKIRKQMQITRESHEILILRRGRRRAAWCNACHSQVDWLTAEDAAQIIGATVLSIYRCAEAGTVHSCETPDGRFWICIESLLRTQQSRHRDQEQ